MRYYQFGDKFIPDMDSPGSGRQWFFFRLCHKIRVEWENEQHRKQRSASEKAPQQPAASGGVETQKPSSGPSERVTRGVLGQQGERQEPEPVKRAREERETIQAAQKRLGVEEYNRFENTSSGKSKPKGFKGTRLKRSRGR